MFQWLGPHTFKAKGAGSIPGQGTKIPQAKWHGQKKKKQKARLSPEATDPGLVVTVLSASLVAEELDGGRPSEEAPGPGPHDGAGD